MPGEPREADTLQRILHEATRLFVASGYEGASMREIAEAVGITKAGLYYHFDDKEELFMAILYASLAEIGRILDEAEAQGQDARGKIEAAIARLLALPAERRALIRVASQEMVHVSPGVRAEFNEVYHRKFAGRIAAILEEGMRRGEVRAVEPLLAAWLLLGLAYPFFYPAGAPGGGSDVAALLVSVFFDGLGTRGQRDAG